MFLILSHDSEKEPLEQRYDELMRLVAEIGKDIKPAYTNSKVQGDRLKKSACVCVCVYM